MTPAELVLFQLLPVHVLVVWLDEALLVNFKGENAFKWRKSLKNFRKNICKPKAVH